MLLRQQALLSQDIEAAHILSRVENMLRPDTLPAQKFIEPARFRFAGFIGTNLTQSQRHRFRPERADHLHLPVALVDARRLRGHLDDQPVSYLRPDCRHGLAVVFRRQ